MEDTPNQEEIDQLEERIREIYQYEKLKDCDIDFLYNHEFLFKADRMIFEAGFPSEEGLTGTDRAWAFDDPTDTREALTEKEQMRLKLLEREVTVEIHRAFGHRKELRREHRSDIANAIADALGAIANLNPFK